MCENSIPHSPQPSGWGSGRVVVLRGTILMVFKNDPHMKEILTWNGEPMKTIKMVTVRSWGR